MNIRTLSKVSLSSLVTVSLSALSHAAEWKLNGNGVWNDNANWANPATFPNAVGADANFTTINLGNHRNVHLDDQVITIGSLSLGSSANTRTYKFYSGPNGDTSRWNNKGNQAAPYAGPGKLVFDAVSGNATLTKTTGGGDQIWANVTLNDYVEYSTTGSAVFFGGIIDGPGGFIVNGGSLHIRSSDNNYTGDTIVNAGEILLYTNTPVGNIVLNNGLYRGYYNHTMNRTLGAGPNQIRITGGNSGFGWNNNLTVRFNNNSNSVVQWGSTHFNPTKLVIDNPRTSGGGSGRFENILDLNGGARTFDVRAGRPGLYWYMNREIRDVAGGGSLIKVGNGVLALNAVNTYTGDTDIQEGTLRLHTNGTIASNNINIAAGAFFDVSAKGVFTPAAGQKLTGAGTVIGATTIASGAIIAPGNSPGTTFYSSNQTWGDGGMYEWEIQDWTGVAGDPTGWDLINITDLATDPSLDITATSGDPFIIEVTEFSLTNFDNSDQTFEILRTDGGITGFDVSDFSIDTTNWTQGGVWAIDQQGNSLVLNFTAPVAIPEPSTTALLGLGGLALVLRRRK